MSEPRRSRASGAGDDKRDFWPQFHPWTSACEFGGASSRLRLRLIFPSLPSTSRAVLAGCMMNTSTVSTTNSPASRWSPLAHSTTGVAVQAISAESEEQRGAGGAARQDAAEG